MIPKRDEMKPRGSYASTCVSVKTFKLANKYARTFKRCEINAARFSPTVLATETRDISHNDSEIQIERLVLATSVAGQYDNIYSQIAQRMTEG